VAINVRGKRFQAGLSSDRRAEEASRKATYLRRGRGTGFQVEEKFREKQTDIKNINEDLPLKKRIG